MEIVRFFHIFRKITVMDVWFWHLPYAVESVSCGRLFAIIIFNYREFSINLYEAWNKPEKAKEWRAKLPQIEATNE